MSRLSRMSEGILTRLAALAAALEAARLAALEAAFDAARLAALDAAFDAARLAALDAALLAALEAAVDAAPLAAPEAAFEADVEATRLAAAAAALLAALDAALDAARDATVEAVLPAAFEAAPAAALDAAALGARTMAAEGCVVEGAVDRSAVGWFVVVIREGLVVCTDVDIGDDGPVVAAVTLVAPGLVTAEEPDEAGVKEGVDVATDVPRTEVVVFRSDGSILVLAAPTELEAAPMPELLAACPGVSATAAPGASAVRVSEMGLTVSIACSTLTIPAIGPEPIREACETKLAATGPNNNFAAVGATNFAPAAENSPRLFAMNNSGAALNILSPSHGATLGAM